MIIRFVPEIQAQTANATLSDELIQELTDKCPHPLARHRGLSTVHIPSVQGEDKIVVNKALIHHHSPARIHVMDQETIDKIVAELGGSLPQVAKSSKKKK